jgi:hypothetical protein
MAFHPKILFHPVFRILIVYGLFLLLGINTFWKDMDDWNSDLLYKEYYQILVGTSILLFFLITKSYYSYAKIVFWSILFVFVTSIMSLVSSSISPMYARDIVGAAAILYDAQYEEVMAMKRYGGGGYGFAIALMILTPAILYLWKFYSNSYLFFEYKWRIFWTLILTMFTAMISMQIFSNVIIAFALFSLAMFGMRNLKKSSLVLLLIIIVFLFVPRGFYVNALLNASSLFSSDSEFSFKFAEMARYIEFEEGVEGTTTAIGNRAERYPMLFYTFKRSPMMGCYFFSGVHGNDYRGEGAHLHWMNKLTVTGLIGFMIFLVIIYKILRFSIQSSAPSFRFYLLLGFLGFVVYGFVKVIMGREAWYALLVILPGLQFLPLLFRTNRVNP